MSLEIKNLSYVYSPGTPMEREVLHDISLTLDTGDFIGIIGHTGSGKSTLIQHFNGLLKPSSGDVLYDGESIYAPGYNRRTLRGNVGLVFQYPEYQIFETDVLTDICFGPKNQGFDEETAKARARHAMKLVGLNESYETRSPFDMSGGQKRRVAIAGVLAMRPHLLVLDEPAAGLDPRGKRELLDQISRIHREWNMGIVLVSHSMEDVANYVNRLIVLSDGRIAFDDTPREIFRHRSELEAMGLSVPQVTQTAYGLRERGWDIPENLITVEETKEEILKQLQGLY